MYAWACMYVCMYVEHVCMLGPLEVPPLTNLKKLNKTFNTEGFPWGIGPSPGMMIYGLKHTYIHTYMLGDIHTCIHTYIDTYICMPRMSWVGMYVCMYVEHVCMYVEHVCMYVEHVCMLSMHVCMLSMHRPREEETRPKPLCLWGFLRFQLNLTWRFLDRGSVFFNFL